MTESLLNKRTDRFALWLDQEMGAGHVLPHFRFCNGTPLHESHPDELVNVLESWEIHPKGKVQHFSWITDILLTRDNVWDLMRGGTSPQED